MTDTPEPQHPPNPAIRLDSPLVQWCITKTEEEGEPDTFEGQIIFSGQGGDPDVVIFWDDPESLIDVASWIIRCGYRLEMVQRTGDLSLADEPGDMIIEFDEDEFRKHFPATGD